MLNEAYEQEYQTHIAKRKLETEQGAEDDDGTVRKKKKSKRSENSSEKPVLSGANIKRGLEEEHILLEKQANPAKGNSKKPKSKKKNI